MRCTLVTTAGERRAGRYSIPVSLHLASLTNRLPCRESTRALFLYLKKIATTPNKHNYSFQKVVFAKRCLVDLI